MAHAGVDRLRVAGGRAVAPAVVRRAEMRAAFDNLPWNPYPRIAIVVALAFSAATRVLRNAAGLRRIRRMPGREPVRGPLPHIADHVEQAIAVGRKCLNRRGARVAVAREVLARK